MKSFDDEPILILLQADPSKMTEEELQEFTQSVRNLRTINQSLHSRLKGESQGTTTRVTSTKKVDIDKKAKSLAEEYENL